MLKPDLHIPSRTTLRTRIKEMLDEHLDMLEEGMKV